jgi:hypothetical protein
MDSSIECLTFAFNALGFGCLPDEFRNITTEKGLRQINPRDISGPMPDDKETRAAPTGYMTIFPSLQKFWRGSTKLIQEVTDQHDVSKHRESIFTGGRARTDAPPSFFENLGVPDDAAARAMFWPMKEIILRRFPRRPQELRKGLEKEPRVVFENLTEQCINFIEETGRIALNDAKRNITLQQDYL